MQSLPLLPPTHSANIYGAPTLSQALFQTLKIWLKAQSLQCRGGGQRINKEYNFLQSCKQSRRRVDPVPGWTREEERMVTGAGSNTKGFCRQECQGGRSSQATWEGTEPRHCPTPAFLCQLLSPWFSCTYSMSLFGVWFEDLGGSGWDFGRRMQVNDLAWMARSQTSSIPPPIMPQLFPVKHSFFSESTLNSMKENVKGRGEGRGEEKKGKCHRCLLFGCVCGFSLQLDPLPPGEHPAL